MPRRKLPAPEPVRHLFGLSQQPGHDRHRLVLRLEELAPLTAAAAPSPGRFTAVLCVEGVRTTDHREIAPGALTWRTLPLPFMGLDTTTWGHDGAVFTGTIDGITRDGTGRIIATGDWYGSEAGQKFADYTEAQAIRWVSVDLEVISSEFIEVYDDDVDPMFDDDWFGPMPDDWWERITEARIMGATQCPFPALPQAVIVPEGQPFPTVEADNGLPTISIAASGVSAGWAGDQPVDVPLKPPAAWFTDPQLDRLTHLTVTDEGRVFGHVASWEQRHIGYDRAVYAPRSPSMGAYYCTSQGVECDDGTRPRTGAITLGTGHADPKLGWRPAAEHYDHTGAAVADVVYGEDDHGPWVAGALRPGVTAAQVRALTCSDVSGDWRAVGSELDIVGVLVVNVPGFPIPALAASGAAPEEVLVGHRGAEVARIGGARLLRTGEGAALSLVAAAVIRQDPVAKMTEAFARMAKRVGELEDRLAVIEPEARRQALTARTGRILG